MIQFCRSSQISFDPRPEERQRLGWSLRLRGGREAKAGAFAYSKGRRGKGGSLRLLWINAADQRSALWTGLSVSAAVINWSKSFLNFSREGVSMYNMWPLS